MSLSQNETATLAGGCFWCLEACFSECRGVSQVLSGFMAGDPKQTSYKEVCSGRTGHAEVVQITFNPSEIAFQDLLLIFLGSTIQRRSTDKVRMSVHNTVRRFTITPTSKNKPRESHSRSYR